MPAEYRIQVDEKAANQLLRSPDGAVARDLLRRGKRVEAKAQQLVGVDTGRLRSSITTRVVFRGNAPAVQVGTNVKYAAYHHDGVGVFGSGQPIRPKRAKVLVFKPKGSKVKVYARQVQGYKGTKFLTKALDAAA